MNCHIEKLELLKKELELDRHYINEILRRHMISYHFKRLRSSMDDLKNFNKLYIELMMLLRFRHPKVTSLTMVIKKEVVEFRQSIEYLLSLRDGEITNQLVLNSLTKIILLINKIKKLVMNLKLVR